LYSLYGGRDKSGPYRGRRERGPYMCIYIYHFNAKNNASPGSIYQELSENDKG